MKCEIEFPDDLEAWKTHRLAGECRKVKRGEWYLGDDGKAWQWTSSDESIRYYHILTPRVKKYVSIGWMNKYRCGLGGIHPTKEQAKNLSGSESLATVEVFEEVEE